MSKMTLGQRKLPTLGQRSTLPKSYVGPTLSCYLGPYNYGHDGNLGHVTCLFIITLVPLHKDASYEI